MSELKINLVGAPISTFERGSSASATTVKPVCALGLGETSDGYRIKALFKHQDARDVYNYMTSRMSFKDQIVSETVDIAGSIREFRAGTKEIVLDNITSIKFKLGIEIAVK